MRNVLRPLLIGILALGSLAWMSAQFTPAPRIFEGLQPYSMQLHLHGSMSEGSGSMRGANIRAQEAGVDVLWWTDHDWRIAYHTYINGWGFEADALVSEQPVTFTSRARFRLEQLQKGGVTVSGGSAAAAYSLTESRSNGSFMQTHAALSTERAIEGTRSFLLQAAPGANGDFNDLYYTFEVARRRTIRSLASNVVLHIAIYPEGPVPAHTIYGMEATLSQQPPEHGQVRIRYVLTGLTETQLAVMNTATLRYIKLPFTPDQWNTYDLQLTRDAARLGFGGEDNSLNTIAFGLQARQGQAKVFFDDYRIRHDIQGPRLLARQRGMARALSEEFGTVNYVGQEFSYQAHLNAFGETVPLLDHDQFPLGLEHRETAEFIHRNGGICSLNHIYGTSRPPRNRNVLDPAAVREWENEQITRLTDSYCYGIDMLEVGYPVRILPIESFLRVWDALSANQVYVTGNGTSDTHGNSAGGWLQGNNFVTWAWAASKSQEDLIEGLRLGRAFFGDPAKFQGTVCVSTEEGYVMGQVVVTKSRNHRVHLDITGVMEGAKIQAIINGLAAKEWIADGPVFHRTLDVNTAEPTFVRLSVWRPNGSPLVFSNPVYFAPTKPERVPAGRLVMHEG